MPIRPSRLRLALLVGTVLVLGSVFAVFGGRDWPLVGIGVFLVAVGALMLGGLVLGVWPAGHLRFDPGAFAIGFRKGEARIPWSALRRIEACEYQRNAAVLLWVDPVAIVAEPSAFAPALLQQMASARAWMGADFAIVTTMYGIDAEVLAAVLGRYALEPEAREELAARPRLGKHGRAG